MTVQDHENDQIGPFKNTGSMTHAQMRTMAQWLITMDARLGGGLTEQQKASLIAHFGPLQPTSVPQYMAKKLTKYLTKRQKAKRRASSRR